MVTTEPPETVAFTSYWPLRLAAIIGCCTIIWSTGRAK